VTLLVSPGQEPSILLAPSGLAADPRLVYRPCQLIHTVAEVSSNGSSAGAHHSDVRLLRAQLSNLRALLVLSILMTESADDEQILRLAVSAASALGAWRIAGFAVGDTWRTAADGAGPIPPLLNEQLRALPDTGGQVAMDGGWAWAYPLRSIAGPIGHMVACAACEPSGEEQFLAQVVAQQTGVAVSNARLHARERGTAAELAQANTALEDTVATLRRGMHIHERLTRVEAAGDGAAGIAEALHDLTGLPVAVEDRYGNLSAWAGPGQPDPYPKPSAYERAQLLRRLMAAGRSVRDGDRVVALASPRPGVLGLLAFIDPHRRSGSTDVMAIEHGATVLAVELARLRGLADTELRVRRELVQDLLTGTDDESAYLRAEALDYDLGPPHQVAVMEVADGSPADEDVLLSARRALRHQHVSGLLGTVAGAVVVVVPACGTDWEALRLATVAQLGGGGCRLGVGEAYPRPSMLPRSLREAQLALRLQKASAAAERTSAFADLDVLRMLASVEDLADVDGYVRKWLGVLADYDERKHTQLVPTLTQYLQHGGGYEATSLALSVHRSTLKYRLHRIRELAGFDLGDPETRFNLELATRAWVTLQALRG
jgi:PucR C-terminal helix-turn-helix domain/GGDEF-like domain